MPVVRAPQVLVVAGAASVAGRQPPRGGVTVSGSALVGPA